MWGGLTTRRKAQFVQEARVDARLRTEGLPRCASLVTDYLFHLRQWNRSASLHLYTAAFYSYPGIVNQHMEKIEQWQTLLSNSSDVCSTLRRCLQDIGAEIRQYDNHPPTTGN